MTNASNAPRAFAALLNDFAAHRAGWRNKFTLKACVIDGFNQDEPVILRCNADGTSWPWTPTEDDLFASDWCVGDDAFNVGPPDDDIETFAAALFAIQSGREVPLGALRLALGETHGGPCIDVILPNGVRRLWRPQHQDLWAGYDLG